MDVGTMRLRILEKEAQRREVTGGERGREQMKSTHDKTSTQEKSELAFGHRG